jgi:hypothetical protein
MLTTQVRPSAVLNYLETTKSKHPHGVYELEIMQECPDFTLLSLRAALDELAAEGKIRREAEGPRNRIQLVD